MTGLLHQRIARVAAEVPDRIALIQDGTAITFSQLHDRIGNLREAIAARTEAGDRVAVIGANHRAWIDAYYAVPAAGRILVFLNHRLSAPELAELIRRSRSRLLVGPGTELARLGPHLTEADVEMVALDEWEEMSRRPSAHGGQARVAAEDPAWLIYTSGTTGRPKGATLTHRNLAAAIEASAHGRPVAGDEVYLYPFPLCHVSGYNVLRVLAAGRPVVVADRFTAAGFVDLADRHRVTSTSLAATMLVDLLDHLAAGGVDRRPLRSLRLVAYGAAPMPPSVLERAAAVLGVDFTGGFGMTELSGNAIFLGIDDHRRGLAGSPGVLSMAGRPAPNVSIRLVDDADRDVAVGSPGELLVRGDQVMRGYWDDEEATRRAFSGDWFHTGDIAVSDDAGMLRIVDRKKDVIISGGENVSSLEVEEQILRTCPEVREVAVIGIADPRWGENVCAVVVLRPGEHIGPEILVARVRGNLAGYKVPRHVVTVDTLPRNSTGKVLKKDLRHSLSHDPDRLGRRL